MLKSFKQWVVHREKMPLNPASMEPCNPHDPNNWLSYEEATATGLEVGFVLTENDPYWCLDIDHCREGEGWSKLALDLLTYTPGCLVEVSRSGEGLHVWGSGPLPEERSIKNTKLRIELYSEERFIAWTGNVGPGGSEDAQPDMTELVAQCFPPRGVGGEGIEWVDAPAGTIPDDDMLLKKMLSAKGSAAAAFGFKATLKDLWFKTETAMEQYGGDLSSLDMALLNHLAFWTNKNPVRMERLFSMSALVRPKWEKREKYRRDSIVEAIVGCKQTFREGVEPERPGEAPAAPVVTNTSAPTLREGYQFLAVDRLPDYFERCAYIVMRGAVLLPNGELVKPDKFRALYGGYVFALDSIGDKTTKDAFEAFTNSQAYHFPKVDRCAFRPELPPWCIVREQGMSMINSYSPIAMPKRSGDASRFTDHIHKMLPHGRDAEILISYMAACVQYPGIKFQWWPVIQGVEGNGKTLLFRVMERCLGDRYCALPNPRELGGKFNGWIENKLFAFIDEIKVPGHRAEMLEALKELVTNETLTIEKKGIDSGKGDNRANGMMGTNYKDAIPVTVDSRRYAILYTAQQTKADIEAAGWGRGSGYFKRLYDWLRAEGYEIVHGYLAEYRIAEDLNPANMEPAPTTSSTGQAIENSLGPVEQQIKEAVDSGREGFCGGWISSRALEDLLTDKHLDGKVSMNKRREMLQRLGYDYHPALQDGRSTRLLACDRNTKPRLFVHATSPARALQYTAEAIENYERAQREQKIALFAV